MASRETKRKAPKKRTRRIAVQSAASEGDILKNKGALTLSHTFDYLEERIPGKADRRPQGASLPTGRAPKAARTATIHVDPDGTTFSAVQKRFTKAWKTGEYVGEHFGFRSPAALCRAITPSRWELLALLQKSAPADIPSLAHALGRDPQRVHNEVAELTRIGLLEKTRDGKVWVPFQEIRTHFVLRR